MRTILCLVAALAGANADTINCQSWSGSCGSRKKADVVCDDGSPKGRSADVLEERCSSIVCCRDYNCADVISCPSGYTRRDARDCVWEVASRDADVETVGTRCTKQNCCHSTCGAAVVCPAKMDSEVTKLSTCVPPTLAMEAEEGEEVRHRGGDVLSMYRQCTEGECCLDTCASAYTCPDDLNSSEQAKAVCVVPRKVKTDISEDARGRLADSAALGYLCAERFCCRASCTSQKHACPAGKVFGKHALRACTVQEQEGSVAKADDKLAFVLESPVEEETACSDDTCCEVVHKCAAGFDCKTNAKHKTNMASVTCIGRACEVADCCVDEPVTCAEAESLCTGNSTLKTTASAAACGLSDLAADDAKCTLEKCCNYKKNVACADNTACRAGGDSGATCLNGVCQCTANYLPTATNAENVLVQGCDLNRIWFSLNFPEGDFAKLTDAHQEAIASALAKLLKKLRMIRFSRGSIVVSGEAETLFDSVSQAAIGAAVQGAAPQSVLGSAIETAFSKVDLACTSTDAGAVTAVKATFNGKEECVPTLCNVQKGYLVQPVNHRCVLHADLEDDDDLSTGAKVGIALGVIAFVAIVVGVVVLVVLKGGKSESQAATAENEPAADVKEMSNEV